MPKVRAIFFSVLRNITNTKELLIDVGTNVGEVLEECSKKFGKKFEDAIYDENGNLKKYINVSVNGKDIRHKKGLETNLEEGDELALLPSVAGG